MRKNNDSLLRLALITTFALAGCAAEDPEDDLPELESAGDALEYAGEPADECDGFDCGPETLVASDGTEAAPSEEPAEDVKVEKTKYGRSVILSVSTTGASLTANVVWVNAKKFELHNVKLKDTSCDDKSVYFHVHMPGFQFPDHWNKKGCGDTVTWSNLTGSSSSTISSIYLDVCRNKNPDNCKGSESAVNPYAD